MNKIKEIEARLSDTLIKYVYPPNEDLVPELTEDIRYLLDEVKRLKNKFEESDSYIETYIDAIKDRDKRIEKLEAVLKGFESERKVSEANLGSPKVTAELILSQIQDQIDSEFYQDCLDLVQDSRNIEEYVELLKDIEDAYVQTDAWNSEPCPTCDVDFGPNSACICFEKMNANDFLEFQIQILRAYVKRKLMEE